MDGRGRTGRAAFRGGARQARADLRAATTPTDPKKIAAATDILRIGDKLRRAYRTFGKSHPTALLFIDELTAALGRFLGTYDELGLTLDAHAASVDGAPVYTAPRPEDSYFYVLYHDGVRHLRFLAGIDRGEVEALFEILSRPTRRGPRDEEGEDDAVTLLWEQDLDHVEYVVAETFGESGDDADAMAQQRAAAAAEIVSRAMQLDAGALADDARRRPLETWSRADLTLLMAENLAALDELPEAATPLVLRPLFGIDPTYRRRFVALLLSDPFIVERYIEALVAALLPGADPADGAEIVVLIGQCVEAAAAGGGLRRAAQLVLRVRRLLPREEGGDVTAAVAKALASDAICDGVAVGLCGDDDAAIGALVLASALPVTAAAKLTERLARVVDRKRRRKLCDELARFGAGALAAAASTLARADEDHGLDLLYLIRRVGGATAVELLERATRHPLPRIRFEALRAYLAAADPAAAERRGRAAARDPDPGVRRVALEHFVATRSPAALALIEDLMRPERWAKADFGDKKRICLALAMVRGAEAIPMLRERLGRKNLLGRADIDEERAAAAAALGLLRDEESRPTLEKLAGSRLTRAQLRAESEEALAHWGQAPRVALGSITAPPVAAVDDDDD